MDTLFIIGLFFCLVVAEKAEGPKNGKEGFVELDGETHPCDQCQWTSPSGAYYDLSPLCHGQHSVKMDNPRSANMIFGVCDVVPCNCQSGAQSMACVFVPGNPATSTGERMQFEEITQNIPGKGVRLILHDGEICSITNKPRKTIIDFECQMVGENSNVDPQASRAWEGEGSDICTYYIKFPTSHGCPKRRNVYSDLNPRVTAVTGCVNSVPNLSVTECAPTGGTELTIHGLDFMDGNNRPQQIDVFIGQEIKCVETKIIDVYTMTCKLNSGAGENHPLTILFVKMVQGSGPEVELQESYISSSQATVSYKPLIDYRSHFNSFVDFGVGGLTKQIKQLYQRAFASRSIPGSVLKDLGIEHAKGILLHGPPGSGKTLLARTIAQILKTDQVKLINAPEIMSKYLGESEKNLRAYFEEAEKAWAELGDASDLYVIIIDEIDAICKQRGKSDASAAAAAYDSVVNQLLTKMDGLKSLHNVLVIGMTNRQDMIDPALLRPGRFEINIEIGLPDENGRWEIFYIHTRQMKEHGYLSDEVDLKELAKNTTQFSGAEIAGIVRLAASFALDRKYASGANDEILLITKEDFLTALDQTKPAYTQKEDQLVSQFLPRGYKNCGQSHDTLLREIAEMTESLLQSQDTGLTSVLLYGDKGVGKSGLAAHVASQYKFTHVKVISPSSLLRFSEDAQADTLIDIFQEAYKASYSLVILDDIHNLAQVVNIAGQIQASHTILHTLSTLLSSHPPQDSKVLVVGTILCPEQKLENYFTGKVGLQDMFTKRLYVPKLNAAATLAFLDDLTVHREGEIVFRLPNHFGISVGDLLKVSDCVEFKAGLLKRTKSEVPQSILDACLEQYPHIEPMTFNI